MARTPSPRSGRRDRPTRFTSSSHARRLGRLALLTLAAALPAFSLTGCAGGGFGAADPLTPQADCARRSVPLPAAVPREFAKTLLPTYRLAPGDTVLVEPANFDTPLRFPADQPVQPDGTIDLGRFGRVPVAGMSVAEVEELVARRVQLVADRDEALAEAIEKDPTGAEVNVRLIDPAGSVYYVLGAVNAPGVYQLAGRETVLDAILTAGGLADNAKRCDIVLSRPSVPHDCRTVLPVCYDNLVQCGDSATNYQVLPGDRIFVPAKGCKDTMRELFGCDKGCDLCACHPQFPCGSDAKACPTPTRYAALCPDAAGVRTLDFLGLPGLGGGDVPPAPAPPTTGTDGGEGNDDVPAPAPAPLPVDDATAPNLNAPNLDAPEMPADVPATDPADAPAETETEQPIEIPAPPEIPDLPDLDDLAAGRARFSTPAAFPAAPVAPSAAPVVVLPASYDSLPDLPTLSSEGL